MIQGIHTNLASLNTQRNLGDTRSTLQTSIQRLSTGQRVTTARDDAAGVAIADRMSAQERGMNVAIRNANDGISLAQVAESTLGRVTDWLQRMRELTVQAADATNTPADRDSLDEEFGQLAQAARVTLRRAAFNGQLLFAGPEVPLTFHVGPLSDGRAQVEITINRLRADERMVEIFGGAATIAGETGDTATSMISKLDTALALVETERVRYGSLQSRFEAVIGSLQVASENQSAARSRIMDADFAGETAALTRARILQQAGTAMLAQANASPQVVLSLLRD